MRHAVALLAQGWYRGSRRWWRLTIAILAIVSTLVVLVVGAFEGMEQATDDRIEAFFTGSMRITPDAPGAAPDVFFENGTAAMAMLQDGGYDASGRVESTYLLSRRTLIESYREEDGQYQVAVPGVDASGQDFYGVGLIIGVDTDQAADVAPLRPYRVAGAFPRVSVADPDVVPVMMSVSRFAQTLSPGERENMTQWPPTAAQMQRIQFELTLARIDSDSPFKDVIRRPAQVVGLFETRLDALDAITLIAPIGSVRELLGAEPDDPVYNAFTIRGTSGGVEALAAREAWGTETPQHFAGRYVGQIVAVVEFLSVAVAVLLYAMPAFLVFVGLSQVLDRHEREVAVCRAIGVPSQILRGAVVRLLATIGLFALGAAAVLFAIGAVAMSTWLPDWRGSPVPLGFVVPWWAYALTLGLTMLIGLLAAWSVVRQHEAVDLASRLRAA